MPYLSHEMIVEDNKPDYHLALRQSPRTFNTGQDTNLPWLTFFLEVTLYQARIPQLELAGF